MSVADLMNALPGEAGRLRYVAQGGAVGEGGPDLRDELLVDFGEGVSPGGSHLAGRFNVGECHAAHRTASALDLSSRKKHALPGKKACFNGWPGKSML